MGILRTSVFAAIALAVFACGAAIAGGTQAGNLGYNSYEGYLSGGKGLNKYFGPGVGYPSENGDFFRRYYSSGEWGQFGYGTGHLGQGWGPYIYSNRRGETPRGMYDPLPEPYTGAPPPAVKIKNGRIIVAMRGDLPGVTCVTVTLLAFNNAELATMSLQHPPFKFDFPVPDGVKNVRVRVDYINNGLSATSYPL